jgi:hypothetical protein
MHIRWQGLECCGNSQQLGLKKKKKNRKPKTKLVQQKGKKKKKNIGNDKA